MMFCHGLYLIHYHFIFAVFVFIDLNQFIFQDSRKNGIVLQFALLARFVEMT